ncbi:adenosylmethionine decarboxylase [Photorhabdus sp. UCH-936]|nr:adenosylmethionine decarboxylase [Photorhabdus antumapuensis]
MDDRGFHNIWDIVLHDNEILSDANTLNTFFLEAIKKAGFRIIGHIYHKFADEGEGVTGLFLLSESHLSFHTYPETNYISIDVYTCGKQAICIHNDIENFFKNSKRFTVRGLERGSRLNSSVALTEKIRMKMRA